MSGNSGGKTDDAGNYVAGNVGTDVLTAKTSDGSDLSDQLTVVVAGEPWVDPAPKAMSGYPAKPSDGQKRADQLQEKANDLQNEADDTKGGKKAAAQERADTAQRAADDAQVNANK